MNGGAEWTLIEPFSSRLPSQNPPNFLPKPHLELGNRALDSILAYMLIFLLGGRFGSPNNQARLPRSSSSD